MKRSYRKILALLLSFALITSSLTATVFASDLAPVPVTDEIPIVENQPSEETTPEPEPVAEVPKTEETTVTEQTEAPPNETERESDTEDGTLEETKTAESDADTDEKSDAEDVQETESTDETVTEGESEPISEEETTTEEETADAVADNEPELAEVADETTDLSVAETESLPADTVDETADEAVDVPVMLTANSDTEQDEALADAELAENSPEEKMQIPEENEGLHEKAGWYTIDGIVGGQIYFDGRGTITNAEQSITSAIIPAEIEGIPVTTIGGYAFMDSNMTKLVISEGILAINYFAFGNCYQLTSVTLPSSISYINYNSISDFSGALTVYTNEENYVVIEFAERNDIEYIVQNTPEDEAEGIAGWYDIEGSRVFLEGSGAISDADKSATSLVIPGEINGVIVNKVLPVFSDYHALRKLVLPESVTEIFIIGPSASLTSLTLSSKTTSIRKIEGADNLTIYTTQHNDVVKNYAGENGIKYVVGTAPAEAPMPEVYQDEGAGWFAVDGISGGEIYFNNGVIEKIDHSVTDMNIPEKINGITVTEIVYYAFNNVHNLQSVHIPKGVTEFPIPEFFSASISVDKDNQHYTYEDGVLYNKDKTELIRAFEQLPAEYVVESTVAKISNFAFFNQEKIDYLELPDNISTLSWASINNHSGAFDNLTIYTKNYNEYVETYSKERNFDYIYGDQEYQPQEKESLNGWMEVDGVVGGKVLFENNVIIDFEDTITKAHLPKIVNGIEIEDLSYGAFHDCSVLTEVSLQRFKSDYYDDLPNFAGCYSLENIILSDEFEYTTFRNGFLVRSNTLVLITNTKSDTIHIDTSVSYIDSNAFLLHTEYKEILIDEPNYYLSSYEGIIYNVEQTELRFIHPLYSGEINLPPTFTSIYLDILRTHPNITGVNISDNSEKYYSSDGFLYEHASDNLLYYPTGREDETFAVPVTVTRLVYQIFKNTNIERVEIPDTIQEISKGAFSANHTITEIVVALGNEFYKSENGFLFSKNGKILEAVPPGISGVVELPEGITNIGYPGFADNYNVTDVIVPKSVTFIDNRGFNYGVTLYSYLDNMELVRGIANELGLEYQLLLDDATSTTEGENIDEYNPIINQENLGDIFTTQEAQSGKTLETKLIVNKITPQESEQKLIDNKLAELAKESQGMKFNILDIFDISLQKIIGGIASNVTELNRSARITISIPKEFIHPVRTFSMLRIHGGIVDVLQDLDNDPTTFTLDSNLFSTYALVYSNSAYLTYFVTLNPNGGYVENPHLQTDSNNKIVGLTNPTRNSMYTFDGWFTDLEGGTEVTADTLIYTDTTLYARWTLKESAQSAVIDEATTKRIEELSKLDGYTEEEYYEIMNLKDDLLYNLDKEKTKGNPETLSTLKLLEEVLLKATEHVDVISKEPIVNSDVPDSQKLPIIPVDVEGLALSFFGGSGPQDGYYELYLEIVQKASDNGMISIDVKPYMQVFDNLIELSNDDIKSPITFKLYLNNSFATSEAKVVHRFDGGEESFILDVMQDANGKYIKVTVSNFSEFIISEVTVIQPTAPPQTNTAVTSPATGDSSNVAWTIVIASIAILFVVVIVISQKKEKHR